MKVGSIEGIVNDLYQIVYDSGELSSAQSSLTISGLNGDIDKEYRLICRVVDGGASGGDYYIRFNNDYGSNYGYQIVYGISTTISSARNTGDTKFNLLDYQSLADSRYFSEMIIYAKSGYVRTVINKKVNSISGTTVTQVKYEGGSWNNIVDNLTSLNLTASQTNGFGIGTRIILLRKVDATSGMKTGILDVRGDVKYAWQEIYSNTLSSAATTVTISNLNGNTDVIYRLRVRSVCGAGGGGGIRLNGDTTGANYGMQYLSGVNTSIASDRGIENTNGWKWMRYDNSLNYLSFAEVLIYVKYGYVRTALCQTSNNISGTTVTGIYLTGFSWNNTADNITSLEVNSEIASGLGVGTVITLERLNL